MKLDHILVGIDFSEPSFAAARWVARHVAPRARLVLAHVISIPAAPPIVRGRFPRRELLVPTVREGADSRLRELARTLGTEQVDIVIREGAPGSRGTIGCSRSSCRALRRPASRSRCPSSSRSTSSRPHRSAWFPR